ncbi:MAG: DMT family transporter [Fluviicola sp.]|nr:DMT family transporter [Fluviicola sp.]
MIELIFSILSSSVLFFLFRLFPKYGVDTAQAIVVNYFTAFICGCAVNQAMPDVNGLLETNLLPYVLLAGFLFISLFVGMGYSSQKNGMGTTSVAVKMSMALAMIFFIIAYNEPVTFLKVVGFILAFAGIFLITFQKDQSSNKGAVLLLLFLFVGSAVLETLLNYAQKKLLNDYPESMFTAFGFLAAGFLGVCWMITEYARKKRTFSWKIIVGGIALGIPNYFSIYLLIKSYQTTGWEDTTTIAVMGIGVVSLAAIFGMLIFKESAKWNKILGLVCAIGAIVLLTVLSKY